MTMYIYIYNDISSAKKKSCIVINFFIRKINEKTDKEVLKYIAESYDFPLPEVDEVERELKRDKRQDN